MNYIYKEYKMKNGIEGISIIFSEKKYELLSTFLSSEVTQFEEWIKENFDMVIEGKERKREIAGNVCGVEITLQKTMIYDMLAEDGMGNWCEVDTKELRQLIDEWCDKVREFKRKRQGLNFAKDN
ncbi:hypothetical protein Osc1_09250 [Hominimerdicola sp. 21CYCFAH17_S]